MPLSDPNIPRWVFASVHQHFVDGLAGKDLPIFIHGQDKSDSQEILKNFCELRIDGPTTQARGRRTKFIFQVNILLQSTIEKDLHKPRKDIGTVMTAFTPAIEVYKYGNGPEDDESFIGCLTFDIQGRKDELRANYFGQVGTKTKLSQASIEAHYEITLKE